MKVNNRRLGFWATLLCIAGCTNHEMIATSVEPTEPRWAHRLAVNPAAFEQLLVRSAKDGWISYHQRDFHSAYTHFSANPSPSSLTGAYRSADAIADQYAMLSRITEKAATRYFDEVAKSHQHTLSPMGKKMAHQNTVCQANPTVATAQLEQRTNTPLHTETTPSGIEVSWYDSCVYRDHNTLWRDRRDQLLNNVDHSDQLASQIFSYIPGDSEEVVPITDRLRSLNHHRQMRYAAATPKGRALLQELGIEEQLLHGVYRWHASAALSENNPQHAMLLALQSFASGKKGGPLVSPMSILILADAQIEQQRYRDALQTLYALDDTHLELRVLREWLGDLSIIKDIDREGDSKEN